MSMQNLKKKLQRIYDEILQLGSLKGGLAVSVYPANKKLRILMQDKLLPLIEESEFIRKNFEKRILYFFDLAKNSEYLKLVSDIHDLMKKLQQLINHELLPDIILPRPRPMVSCPSSAYEDWNILSAAPVIMRLISSGQNDIVGLFDKGEINLKELHSIFDQEEKWWHLSDMEMPFTFHPTITYLPVLKQYDKVHVLIQNALKTNAIINEHECEKIYTAFKHKLVELHSILEGKYNRLNIEKFFIYKTYATSSREIKDVEKFNEARDCAFVVCLDLLEDIDESYSKSLATHTNVSANSNIEYPPADSVCITSNIYVSKNPPHGIYYDIGKDWQYQKLTRFSVNILMLLYQIKDLQGNQGSKSLEELGESFHKRNPTKTERSSICNKIKVISDAIKSINQESDVDLPQLVIRLGKGRYSFNKNIQNKT